MLLDPPPGDPTSSTSPGPPRPLPGSGLDRSVARGRSQRRIDRLGAGRSVVRRTASAAYLHERNGDLLTAAHLYAKAARDALTLPENDYQRRQASRVNQLLCGKRPSTVA